MKINSNQYATRKWLLGLRAWAKDYRKPTRRGVFANGFGKVVDGSKIAAVKCDVGRPWSCFHVNQAGVQELFDRVRGFLGNPVPQDEVPAWALRHRQVAFELGNLLAELDKADVIALADEFQDRLGHVEFHGVIPPSRL
jgi:hypothetical protein